MDKIVTFFKTRKISYWLAFAATLLMIGDLIVYLLTGRTQFDPDYSVRAITGMAFAVALGLIGIVKPIRAAVFAQYVFCLFAFINYATSQLNLLGNLFYNVDGSTAPVSLFIGIGFVLVATVLALISGILMKPAKKAAD